MIDPTTRSVSDINHTVVAAASSTSSSRARQFLSTCNCPSSASAYGSYSELVQDPSVDIIYVATPHSHHYQNTMLCLLAGKNVLCEKAFTVNAAQARKLVETAREKKLFLMEAVWTRFFPLSIQIRKMIEEGEVGAVHRVIADLSFGQDVENTWGKDGAKHRMVNPDLAGGAMLDRMFVIRSTELSVTLRTAPPYCFLILFYANTETQPVGIYPLTWCFQTLYHTVPAPSRKTPSVVSLVEKYETGADEKTSILLSFPAAPGGSHTAHGIALTSFRIATDPDGFNTAKPAIRIQGTKGEIQVDGPAFRPTRYRWIPKEEGTDPQVVREGRNEGVREVEVGIPGHGMFWEADECARCVRDVSWIPSYLSVFYAFFLLFWGGLVVSHGAVWVRKVEYVLLYNASMNRV